MRPAQPAAHPHSGQIPDWLGPSLLLLAALLVLVLMGRAYWNARRLEAGRGIWREMLAILLRDLGLLLRLLRRPARRALAQAVALQRLAGSAARARGRRHGRIDWTQPRAVIIALYLAILALAARRGYPRRPGQTPGEYARELAARIPAANAALTTLTETFAAARYSQAPMDAEAVDRMQESGQAVRTLLRKAP
jgi:hypothetical protein